MSAVEQSMVALKALKSNEQTEILSRLFMHIVESTEPVAPTLYPHHRDKLAKVAMVGSGIQVEVPNPSARKQNGMPYEHRVTVHVPDLKYSKTMGVQSELWPWFRAFFGLSAQTLAWIFTRDQSADGQLFNDWVRYFESKGLSASAAAVQAKVAIEADIPLPTGA